ncbi:MAG: DUF6573 family protein [Planctomycetaceae bacterium]
MKEDKMKEEQTNIVFAYSRAQAIDDGVLIDAGEMAKEAGFRYSVALTAAAWELCVAVPEACPWQDERGRLWDVLNVLRVSSRNRSSSEIELSVLVQNDERGPQLVTLQAVCGPGDDLEPVITVMLPGED